MARPTPDEKVASAKKAICAILELDILEQHKDELLSSMIWKITEAEGKYKLRFCTEGIVKDPDAKRHHEHVFPRKWLIAQMKADPSRIDEVLSNAFGCLITVREHRLLASAPPDLHGWDRYRAVGIGVYDKEVEKWLVLPGKSRSDER